MRGGKLTGNQYYYLYKEGLFDEVISHYNIPFFHPMYLVDRILLRVYKTSKRKKFLKSIFPWWGEMTQDTIIRIIDSEHNELYRNWGLYG